LAQAPTLEPVDLDGVPVLLTDRGCGYRRVFERALSSAGSRPAIAGEFTSGETVKRCVEAGTAIGVLALISVATELDTGRLIALPWKGPTLALSSYLVTHQQRWVSPAHAALREATRRSFSRNQTTGGLPVYLPRRQQPGGAACDLPGTGDAGSHAEAAIASRRSAPSTSAGGLMLRGMGHPLSYS